MKFIYINVNNKDKLEYGEYNLTDNKPSGYKRIDVVLNTKRFLFYFDDEQRKTIRRLYKEWEQKKN